MVFINSRLCTPSGPILNIHSIYDWVLALMDNNQLHDIINEVTLFYKPRRLASFTICGIADLAYDAVLNGTGLNLGLASLVVLPSAGSVLTNHLANLLFFIQFLVNLSKIFFL